jgi:hypothetical protein
MSTRALSRCLPAALVALIALTGLIRFREAARQRIPVISAPDGLDASYIQVETIRSIRQLAPEQTFWLTLTPLNGLQQHSREMSLWEAEAVDFTGESRLTLTFDARTETLIRIVFLPLPDNSAATIPVSLAEAVRRAKMWAARVPLQTRPSCWKLVGKPWHTETDWIVTLQSPPYVSKIQISRRTGRMTHLRLDRQH